MIFYSFAFFGDKAGIMSKLFTISESSSFEVWLILLCCLYWDLGRLINQVIFYVLGISYIGMSYHWFQEVCNFSILRTALHKPYTTQGKLLREDKLPRKMVIKTVLETAPGRERRGKMVHQYRVLCIEQNLWEMVE